MTQVNLNSNPVAAPYARPVPQKPADPQSSVAPAPTDPADVLQLSPTALREVALAGRIALNQQAGNLTTGQASLLDSQLASVHSQMVADKQANGGTLSPQDAQAIAQLEKQLSQTIYSDAHGGAAVPPDANVGLAGVREGLQAGRIALNEKAGNLTSDQSQQLYTQVGDIYRQIATDKQAAGGHLTPSDAHAIHQLQNQLSELIHDTAHGTSSPA